MTWTLAPRRVGKARRTAVALVPAATVEPPSAPSAGTISAQSGQPASLRDWLGVIAMVVGLLMAVMDVQIVTSSLTQIQGGLSASIDEISWVQTSYLIANVIMVPLSGTLSRLLSTRVLFVTAALCFTTASALCATATSLGEMIVFRAMQGFSGGAMMPLVFPVIYTKFRMPQLATVMVLISLILNMSSTLGPTIGGYLTDTFSWHWLFLVNLVPGIGVAVAVWLLLDRDNPDWSLLRQFDLTGLVLMALFLGCLQYALEEGPRWDWFSDNTIFAAVIVSTIAAALFFWRVLSYRQPIVDLRAFTNRNFALGSFYTFMLGTGMYGTTYLIPLFLAQVRGFSALQIGETVVVTGLAQLAMSPISPLLARKMDLRLMLSIGIVLFVVSMYLTAGLTNQTGFAELFVPQVLRGIAMMMCIIPSNLIALGSVPQDKLKNSAGLYNLNSRPRWRHRIGGDRHVVEPTAAFPLEPVNREHQPGAPRSAAFSRQADEPPRCARPGRRRPRGGQAAGRSGAARGAGADLQRCHHAARRALRRRPHPDAAGQEPARKPHRQLPLNAAA